MYFEFIKTILGIKLVLTGHLNDDNQIEDLEIYDINENCLYYGESQIGNNYLFESFDSIPYSKILRTSLK